MTRLPLLFTFLLMLAVAAVPAYAQHTESAGGGSEVPDAYRLTSPYPNPFNPRTQFTLTVMEEQNVVVEVYNLLGRRVAELYDGRLAANQTYTFIFEASNEPSGIYLIRITGKQFTTTQRITLLK